MFNISIVLIGFLLFVFAYIGIIMPVLPGLLLSLLPFVLIFFTKIYHFSVIEQIVLLVYALMVLVLSILDYVLPAMMTKKMGGTKYAARGSTIGLLLSIFVASPLGPFAIIVGPFVGALIGERYANKPWKQAFKSAGATLIAFLVGSLAKMVLMSFILVYYCYLAIQILINI